ncbi:TniB family NTP-binding protein [Paenibacillus humicus]|uniref:TniB family NTP-binding protein n=1 Tax=Paenibacillus humicus TaxID=412861 RepID=UPI003F13C382
METKTKLEKLTFIENIRIAHPKFKAALKLIEEAHFESTYSADPCSILICGDTGSGKTTLFDAYIAQHDKVESSIVDGIRTSTRSILSASVPYPATHSTVTERLLKQLGDPYTNKGTIAQKDYRLTKLIKENHIQLIMLDEIQHFIDRDREKVVYKVSDWFKSLINATKVPVILFGLKESTQVLDRNPQLSRRFPVRYHMKPFGYESQAEQEEFQMLMFAIDKQLRDVFESTSNLADEMLCERMYYATGGSIDSIMKLIRRGAKNALLRDAACIELVDLANAFNLISHINRHGNINPFVIADFSLEKFPYTKPSA